ALRLLRERDQIQQQRLAELRREVAIGLEQLERGESTAYNDETLKEFFDGIKSKGRQLLAERQKQSDV
nr:type II toxin-antitoxin system Phd/YefM family antitoxin [Armatimonadota bacterium]